jgi:hypothetical protein
MLVIASSHINYNKEHLGWKSDFDKSYERVYDRLCLYYGKQIEFCSITTINMETTNNLSTDVPPHAHYLFQIVGTFPDDMKSIPDGKKPKSGKYDIIWVTSGPSFTIRENFDQYCTENAICFYTSTSGTTTKPENFILNIMKNPFHKKSILEKYTELEYNELINYLQTEVYLIIDTLLCPIMEIGSLYKKEELTDKEREYVGNGGFICDTYYIQNLFIVTLKFMKSFKQDPNYYIYKRKNVTTGGYYNKYIKYKTKYVKLRDSLANHVIKHI